MFTLDGKNVAAGEPAACGDAAASYWTTYIASDDVDATAEKIRGAGGTVLMDPFDVFDAGRMTIATDPTGAHLRRLAGGSAHRRAARERPRDDELERVPDEGRRGRAATFYEAVFGVEDREVDPAAEGMPPYNVIQVEGRGVAGDLRDQRAQWATRRRTGRRSSRSPTTTRPAKAR